MPNDERRRGFSPRRQLRGLVPLIVLWCIGLAALAVTRMQTATSLPSLFLDPAYFTGAPWYTGAMSNLAILVWTTGAVFAAAGAWVARHVGRTSAYRFLAVGALATLVLVLDDVFALHAGPLRRALGDSKIAAQLLIVLPAISWALSFRDDIRRTRSLYLIAAVAALGASLTVDVAIGLDGDDGLLVEDGLKLLGILAWSQYFAITSRDIARSAIRTAAKSRDPSVESGVRVAAP
ncbi:MAG: hypothetical protein AB8G26_10660 [Ilumatobacter sp.]